MTARERGLNEGDVFTGEEQGEERPAWEGRLHRESETGRQEDSQEWLSHGGQMRSQFMYAFALTVLLVGSRAQLAGQVRQKAAGLPLEKLELHNVKAEPVTHLGRSAVRVTDAGAEGLDDASRLAIVPGSSFQDGTIEVNLTGDTAPDARPEFRGFVGIAFRVTADRSHYECFYLRPKNGRSEDQLQRNHSVQYIKLRSVRGHPKRDP